MANPEKIQAKDFYDFLPPNVHRTGDIWRGLPTFGMLGKNTSTGIVLTPACDLAQKKCETITYCPILSILEYVNSSSFYQDIWIEIAELLAKLKLQAEVTPPYRFELPLLEEIDTVTQKITVMAAQDNSKQASLLRIQTYARHIRTIARSEKTPLAELATIFSKGRFEQTMGKIVTNAYSGDIHFLPSDGKSAESSAVPTHSVALFRYILTVPVDLLNAAQMTSSENWDGQRENLKRSASVADSFREWPIRLATLKDDFLSDLLSRYVGMQIRLGSRDFTRDSINQFVDQLRT